MEEWDGTGGWGGGVGVWVLSRRWLMARIRSPVCCPVEYSVVLGFSAVGVGC